MDLKSPQLAALRAQVRRFFETEYPQDLLQKLRSGCVIERQDHIRSQKALQARGWFASRWPAEHGGPGWSALERFVFEDELDRAGALNVLSPGVIYVGPVIYTFGSEDQKRRWLPDILESRTLWAQGYSEPEAGSDLASLSLEAQRDGDHYVLNGVKVWTSYARWADWIFCLARTSKEIRRQDGISFICADLSSAGVTVEPIITMDGGDSLNRVIFENVHVPVANRIGEEGGGWRYANFLLSNERLSYARVSRKKAQLRQLRELARSMDALAGSAFAQRLAACEVAASVFEVNVMRALTSGQAAPPAQVSGLKIQATELAQKITELFVELAGRAALPAPSRKDLHWADGVPLNPSFGPAWASSYLFERCQSIYGGANEVQKNIIWRTLGA